MRATSASDTIESRRITAKVKQGVPQRALHSGGTESLRYEDRNKFEKGKVDENPTRRKLPDANRTSKLVRGFQTRPRNKN